MQEVIKKICDVIKDKQRFYLIGHARPDGDCIGSLLGVYFLLKNMGKDARIFTKGPILNNYNFISGLENVEMNFDNSFNPDVYIFLDCGDKNRVGDDIDINGFIINIDHHSTNPNFGDINYVDPNACAVGEQIYYIIKALGEKLTPEICENLYLAIITDTGLFKYSNTNYKTFEIAGELVKNGANPSKIASEFYNNEPAESVLLRSKVMSNLHYLCGGQFCWGEISHQMIEEAGGEKNEPEGLSAKLCAIKGVEISILFREDGSDGLRASFRSKGKINASKIAEKFGGGGHHNASGLYIKGDYESLKKEIISETIKTLQ